MKISLKTFVVWLLLLLALPVQGVMAATMLPCALAPAVSMAVSMPSMHRGGPLHDHQHMLAAQKAQQHHAHDNASQHHHDGKNCNACSACCPGNLMTTSLTVAAMPPQFTAIPFKTGFVALVALALPERPPQAFMA